MKYSAHKLLYSTAGFKAAITPSPTDINTLKEIRKTVRNAIREAFSLVVDYVKQGSKNVPQLKQSGLPKEVVALIDSLNTEQKSALSDLVPKFSSQGSFLYETLNKPCHLPPQQIDLDDGVYLPIEVLRDGPVIGKKLFFLIVDNALKELAKKNHGWEFSDLKQTCARLYVNKNTHIDVPLYAIPYVRHTQLEVAEKRASYSLDSAPTPTYLDKDDVYLAVRNKEHWIKSDPIQINLWFKGAITEHGEILRRICCYLKAWRDYNFQIGGPSSITLMKCVVDSFNKHPRHFKDDSEALLHCVGELPNQLRVGVNNPLEDAEAKTLFPDSKMEDTEINTIIAAAEELQRTIRLALLGASTPDIVINHFISAFGSRIPKDPKLVETAISTTVLSTPPKPQPQPNVPNMQAG